MILDRAGYCFGSALGQSLFDNADCFTSAPQLGHLDELAVNTIRADEERLGCQVSTALTASTALENMVRMLQPFEHIPVPYADGGYACWGYSGPTIALHSGTSANLPVTAVLASGNSFIDEHLSRADWVFVSVVTGPSGQRIGAGWVQHGTIHGRYTCETEAG